MRRSQNTISELRISSNSTLVLQDEIKDFIVNHYKNKFNGGEAVIDPNLFEFDHERISVPESSFMDVVPTLDESKRAVFDLGADSAPGPVGFSDILSRNLSKLLANRSMHNMVSKKGVAPTHLLFADDILVFCRGNLHSLQNLKTMLSVYEKASGQCINYAKSKFYYDGGTYSRSIAIANYLGMERALFPDKYLGIQLKPGIVRHIHVRKVVEKIMDKLAGWKGKLLSFQARLVERAIRNFLWSGDAEKRKFFTVLYANPCCSRPEGGLGLRRLVDINKAMLMKLWISIRDSDKTWARFLRAKYFKLNGVLIDYKLGSTVFPGIRWVYDFVQQHTRTIIGDGANTSLLFDNWLGDFSIAKRLGITSKGPNDFKAKVSDIIFDGAWAIPQSTRDLMVRLNIDVGNLPIIAGGDDYKIWDLDSKWVFSVKSAKAAIRENA
ncbi:uncharacterized protein LOC113351732 [Papaver somniferum]|uniref:uncharacterized protein LOC113351732 n=1 Tax=Papaver somniferum TaxID=3469 RepID=UPI000E700FB6|nr:uncharacterized protein LOC113351732 [Papaver somniferum]